MKPRKKQKNIENNMQRECYAWKINIKKGAMLEVAYICGRTD